MAVLALPAISSADLIKRAVQPALSPDGSTIVFSWQGDLWSTPREGGSATRLTVHPANDISPRWAPDGGRLVFTSDRFGNNDIFSMKPDGSDLRRLTYHSGIEFANSISPDGKYVYAYSSQYTGIIGRYDIVRFPITGGEPVRLTDHPFESEFLATVTPDGSKVVYNRGAYGAGAWRKPGVHSSAMPDIWVADNTVPLSNHRPLAKSEAGEIFPAITKDGWIHYVSNKDGWPNLWRMKLDGSGAKRLTNHVNGTMRYPSVSSDGRWAVYEFESELYLLDTKSGDSKKLAIDVPADQRTNPVQEITMSSGLSGYAIAPDGKRAAIVARGEIFLIPEKGGTTRRLTDNPALDENPIFLDDRTILYVKSTGEKRELHTVSIDGQDKVFYADAKDVYNAELSPDRKMLAFHRGADEVVVMPVGGGTPRVVSKGNFADAFQSGPSFSWSPDNKWLVIDKPTPRAGSHVVVQEVDGNRQVVVARSPWGASSPKFLPNGRGVYFLASLGYGEAPELIVVDLVPQAVTFTEDDLDKIDEPKPAGKPEVKVEIQEEGIESRTRVLTAGGATGAQASPDSKNIWTTYRGQLVSIPVAGGASQPVASVGGPALGLSLGPGSQKLYFVQNSRFFSLALDRGAVAPIPFNAVFNVNLREEEKALFEEIWWSVDRMYYDQAFHGKDWRALKAKFAAIVPYVTDRTDFYALMHEMMEELDSSHLGATPPTVALTGNDATAYLGAEWDPKPLDARGQYVVKSVMPGSPADNPASRLLVGDRILKVDGEEPTAQMPVSALLNKKANRKVVLSIERGGTPMTVEIKPMTPAQQNDLEYEAWVAWQRKETDRLSNGQLAYFHIEVMGEESYQRFLREIRTYSLGKRGALIDVRYNGGGSTAHKVLGVLIKTPWLIRTTRGEDGVRVSENIFRGDSLELPTALLFNSYSFSNAEILGEGFRQLKRGPIIGERTPGYVIGTGGVLLWDGGFIRMPAIGSFTIEGENLENNGRKPDHSVWFDPNAWSAGKDPQLEKAVAELMKNLGR